MKIKFSKTERIAGFFVFFAASTFLGISIMLAYQQGWFTSHHLYKTTFIQGEGLHPGTVVQIAGLRAGTVSRVELDNENRIAVTMRISHEFKNRIREDSLARVIRPYVIGDKAVEITVGSKNSPELSELASLKSEDTLDLMDLLGGGHLGSYFKQLNSLLENMSLLIEAFSDPRRSKALIGMFDELLPTLKDLREFSQQMTHNKNLKISMENISQLTRDINRIMPEMAEFSKKLPELGVSSAKTMEQLSKVTEELNKILPTVARVAPNLPEATQRSVEALKEAVIVLKAMQKSFLLRGAVKDVQEEQAKIDEETKTLGNKNREPSSEK